MTTLFRPSPLWLLLFLLPTLAMAQSPSLSRLKTAIQQLQKDPDLRAASWGVAVIDVQDGRTLAQFDAQRGLSTASTMKAITTATALEILGADHKFTTRLTYDGSIKEGVLVGNVYIEGGGDPSLGSDRFGESYDLPHVLTAWVNALKEKGIERINGAIIGDASYFTSQLVPAKWTWEDIGNYYGAGAGGLNIHENLYELHFRSGRPGTLTEILRTHPPMEDLNFVNEVAAGPSGSGDNGYIYGVPYTQLRYVRGTIPPNRNLFAIKGSLSDPSLSCAQWLRAELLSCGIPVQGEATTLRQLWAEDELPHTQRNTLHTRQSPPLIEILEATNMKSVNLFAEVLAKEIAIARGRKGSTEAGLEEIEAYWQGRGVNLQGIILRDGSGLSPNNAVAPLHMARILATIRKGPNGDTFKTTLPVAGRSGSLKGMLKGTAAEGRLSAKSGYISGVRSYAGYVTLPSGQEVAFAMIANNYACGAGAMRRKLEKLMAALAEGR